jgi:hypothetical protein
MQILINKKSLKSEIFWSKKHKNAIKLSVQFLTTKKVWKLKFKTTKGTRSAISDQKPLCCN